MRVAGGTSAGKTLHMIVAPYTIVPGKGPVKSPLFTMYKPFGLVGPNIMRESQAAMESGSAYAMERANHMQTVAKHTKEHVIHATMEGKMGAMPFILYKFDDISISTR